MLAKMIGSAILRRLYKGTPRDHEAKQYRQQYVWLSEKAGYDLGGDDVFRQDLIEFGEWEALQRHAERSGFPRVPPSAWVAANPEALLLSEDRTSAPRK